MNNRKDSSTTPAPELLQLFERLTDLMLKGDQAECNRLVAEHSEYAAELQAVLPALRIMEDAKSGDTTGMASLPHDDPALSLKGQLGDFQLIREIGRGGMGVVYEAEQLLLGRRVALKVLPFAAMLDERQRLRFQNEARAAATLNHPHIVPIHFVGIDRGIHFYAMQFVQGQSLAELLRDLRRQNEHTDASVPDADETIKNVQAELSTLRTTRKPQYFRAIAELAATVADALQHAHDRGIVHRDIKPSNLLLDSDGKCLISDFGLARLDGDSSLTLSGDVVGTLRYAPPEQILGKQTELGHRADIYSLGATLYELLSLAPAIEGESREQLLKAVSDSKPARLRAHDASIPTDLETIVHKAMEEDVDDRFSTAAEMADELRRFVAGKPIQTRRTGAIQRSIKWVKRHPKMIMAAVALLIVFSTGISTALFAVNQERLNTASQRDSAQENLQLAISALDEVYNQVGSNWIDSERNLSDTQAHFLRRSAKLLTEIANRFPDDSTSYSQAGLAHLHAANANARTHFFDEAAAGYQKACGLLERALQADVQNQGLRESLVTAQFRYAVMCIDRWEFDQARQSLNAALDHTQHLMSIDPSDDEQLFAYVSINTEVLRLQALDLQDDEVIRTGTKLLLRLQRVSDANPDRVNLQLVRIKLATVVSESMRRIGKSADALKLCQSLLEETGHPLQDAQDHRDVARAIAGLIAEKGTSELELKDFASAEASLRDAMSRLRKSFVFDGTPKEFSFAYMKKEATHDQMEPKAFLQYARVQSTLASALNEAKRPEEALALANDAFRTCLAQMDLSPHLLGIAVDAAFPALLLASVQERGSGQAKLPAFLPREMARIHSALDGPNASAYQRQLASRLKLAITELN
ncbi:MAG: serine/threonine protein kinase [Planctomycetales bacterium]|nr:serine/threonine protein kinase [Planctomycetales bacterium]